MKIFKMIFLFSLIGTAFLAMSVAAEPGVDTAVPTWNEHIKTFETLISTESEAAPAELEKVAEKLFGAHPLVDEWKTRYLRLSREQRGSIADLKRANEIVVRMLTDIDADTHREQIQRHQSRFEYYEKQAKDIQSKGGSPDKVTAEVTRFQLREVWMDNFAVLDTHIKAFHEYLPKDKKSAHRALAAYANIRFGDHPLVGKWTDTVFRMCLDSKGGSSDFNRMCKLEIQMHGGDDPDRQEGGSTDSQRWDLADPYQSSGFMRAMDFKEYGDMPEVHIVVDSRLKVRTPEEDLAFIEAMYRLNPHPATYRSLEMQKLIVAGDYETLDEKYPAQKQPGAAQSFIPFIKENMRKFLEFIR